MLAILYYLNEYIRITMHAELHLSMTVCVHIVGLWACLEVHAGVPNFACLCGDLFAYSVFG